MSINSVVLMGRLTADPILKQTPAGVSVATFTLAVDRPYKDGDGEYPTDFINCVAWRGTAEFVCRSFRKGNMLAVHGSINCRTWDDDAGERHWVTEVVIDEASFTGERVTTGKEAAPQEAPVAPNRKQAYSRSRRE